MCLVSVSVLINIRSTSGDIDFERPPGGSTDELSIRVREDTRVGTQIAAIVAHNPVTGRVITNYVKAPNSDQGGYFGVQQETGTFEIAYWKAFIRVHCEITHLRKMPISGRSIHTSCTSFHTS